MELSELIYLIIQLLNEYSKKGLTEDQKLFIETDILEFVNNNLNIKFNNLFISLASRLDKLIHGRVKNDLKVYYKFTCANIKIRLLSRKLYNKYLKLNK